jgi:hypothetical protein
MIFDSTAGLELGTDRHPGRPPLTRPPNLRQIVQCTNFRACRASDGHCVLSSHHCRRLPAICLQHISPSLGHPFLRLPIIDVPSLARVPAETTAVAPLRLPRLGTHSRRACSRATGVLRPAAHHQHPLRSSLTRVLAETPVATPQRLR